MYVMSERSLTIYLKAQKNCEVYARKVKIKDVASVTTTSLKVKQDVENLEILQFQVGEKNEKPLLKVVSVLKLIQVIQKAIPGCEVVSVGEKDICVIYEPHKEENIIWAAIKVVALTILTFFGGAFSIMAFNNDVSVPEIFEKLYKQTTGVPESGIGVLEITFSIGLGIGILLFFNHLSNKRHKLDPTPIQLEIHKYATDVQDTCIENSEQEGETVDVDQ